MRTHIQRFARLPQNNLNNIMYTLMWLSFLLSLYLIYDWFSTQRTYKCLESFQNFAITGYENQTSLLLKELQDATKPIDNIEVYQFQSKLSKVDWPKINHDLNKVGSVMGQLIDQLEGASANFKGPIWLREKLTNEIQEYNLCRNQFKEENRDLANQYEILKNQQTANLEAQKQLEDSKASADRKKVTLRNTIESKKQELRIKESEYKQLEDDLENFQDKAKSEFEREQEERERKNKEKLNELKNRLEESDRIISKLRSERELYLEESRRLGSQADLLFTSRDVLKQKLQKFELKIDYDAQLKKLLPTEQTIKKWQELEKVTQEKFMLNAKILQNMRGLPGEDEQRKEVERLKKEFKDIKQMLSRVSEIKFSFEINFQRQIEQIKSQLETTNNEINRLMTARDEAEKKASKISDDFQVENNKRKTISDEMAATISSGVPRNAEAEKKYEEIKVEMTIKYNALKDVLRRLRGELKDLEDDEYNAQKVQDVTDREYTHDSLELGKKIKDIESKLNKLRKIMSAKLAECSNKKSFIEKELLKANQELKDGEKQYGQIQKSKELAEGYLRTLYIR